MKGQVCNLGVHETEEEMETQRGDMIYSKSHSGLSETADNMWDPGVDLPLQIEIVTLITFCSYFISDHQEVLVVVFFPPILKFFLFFF